MINALRATVFAVSTICLLSATRPADAQVSNHAFVQNYLLRQPAVSPYLNLVRRDSFGGVANYQTLVRPQLEQREFALIQEAELSRLNQELSVQQRTLNTIGQQRAQRVFSTGHRTRFMNLEGYYPGFSQARR
jgi:hypothetical protein